ncbi:MAG TPA: hypothetical protein VH062_02970 [Polyangiaceae bacterium]|jgi:hypothetical protein|nr:hypothetical protein [Polyangiaceae bacterium]
MSRKPWPALAVGVLLVSSRAEADAIDKGTFALGAERITGVFHADEKVANADSSGTTAIALFGNSVDSPLAGAWQFPRLGFDYFVTKGLSLGGSFVVLSRSPEGTNQTDILVAPRVGFGYMFGRVVGIWPRGGISYWHASRSADNSDASIDAHSFAFDVDVPLLIAPVRSFAITIGPVLDVGFAGRADANFLGAGTAVDTSFVQFGLSAGIVGLL